MRDLGDGTNTSWCRKEGSHRGRDKLEVTNENGKERRHGRGLWELTSESGKDRSHDESGGMGAHR